MSTTAHVKTQVKAPAAPAAVRLPQPPMAVPEHEAEWPDVATQLENAARLGHSLGAVSVDGSTPPIVQRQELPEEEEEELQLKREPTALLRQELPEEEEEEELQLKREPAAIQRQDTPEEEEEELQLKREAAAVQRQELPEEEEEEEELMLKREGPRVGPQGGPVPSDVEAAIRRARGSGQPLDGAIQAQMSETLGHDFSGVRVHTDAEADALNQQLQAKAFTTGQDIFFKRSAYAPGSSSGRELIAHELSHVMQQSSGGVSGGGGMSVRPAGDAFEREADALVSQSDFGVSMARVETRESRVQQPGRAPKGSYQTQNHGPGPAVMRMCDVPLFEQKGGTCGLFSLGMAVAKLAGLSEEKEVMPAVLKSAVQQGATYVGEEFDADGLAAVAERVKVENGNSTHQFGAKVTPFNVDDEANMVNVLNGTGANPVLVAYAAGPWARLEWGEKHSPEELDYLTAHWSVAESYNEQSGELQLANPWKKRQSFKIGEVLGWNKKLSQSEFSFKEFAQKTEPKSKPKQVVSELRSKFEGLLKTHKVSNTPQKLPRFGLPKVKVNLKGKLVEVKNA